MAQNVQIQNNEIVGDSHLAICTLKAARPSLKADIGAAVPMKVNRPNPNTEDTGIALLPDGSRWLSKVFVRIQVEDFSDAERRAYFEASSLQNDFAFGLDIPLRITHTHIKEVKI